MNQFFMVLLLFGATLAQNSNGALKVLQKVVSFEARAFPGRIRIEGTASAQVESAVQLTAQSTGSQLDLTCAVQLDALDTGIALRNQHMKENYLEAPKYPVSTLVVSGLDLSKESQSYSGQLTLHGKTCPVKGEVKVRQESGRTVVDMTGTIKMTDFAIKLPQFMGVSVGDEVALKLNFAVEK